MQLCFQNFLFIYEASISDLTILFLKKILQERHIKTFFLSMKQVFLTLLYFFWKRFYKNGDTSISCDIYDL